MFNKPKKTAPETLWEILSEIYSRDLFKRSNKEIFFSIIYLFYILSVTSLVFYFSTISFGFDTVLFILIFIAIGNKIIELQRYKEIFTQNQNVDILNQLLSDGKKEEALIFADQNKYAIIDQMIIFNAGTNTRSTENLIFSETDNLIENLDEFKRRFAKCGFSFCKKEVHKMEGAGVKGKSRKLMKHKKAFSGMSKEQKQKLIKYLNNEAN
jgi:hypothetical protein